MFNQRLLHCVWKGSVAHGRWALHVFTKGNVIVAEMSDLKLTVRREINGALHGSVKLVITHSSQNVKVRDREAWLMGQREEPLGLMTFSLKRGSSPAIPFQLTFVFDILCCLYNTRITRISNTIAPTWFTWGYLLCWSYTWSMRQSQWLLGNGSPHGFCSELPESQAWLSESFPRLDTGVSTSGPHAIEIQRVCVCLLCGTFYF